MKHNYFFNIILIGAALYGSVAHAGKIIHQFDRHYIKAIPKFVDAGDFAGYSVAIDGDIMVVGVPYEDSPATGIHQNYFAAQDNSAKSAGAAYVFERNPSGIWVMKAYLKADNTDTNDRFGKAVAVSGNTIVVTAPGEDSSQETVGNNSAVPPHIPSSDNSRIGAGAAYVFVRQNGTWKQQAYLKAPSSSGLGISAAIDGDRIVLGTWNERVHIFNRFFNIVFSYYAWLHDPTPLTPDVSEPDDDFGSAVAIDGNTIAVGADFEGGDGSSPDDNSRPYSGAAYVFYNNGSNWQQQAYLKASNPDKYDAFGWSVAIDGDTVAVGAPGEDSSGINAEDNSLYRAGAVYLFRRSGSGATATWGRNTPTHYLKAANANNKEYFGAAVALDNGELAVGAAGEDGDGISQHHNYGALARPESGAVYVFTRQPILPGNTGIIWSQVAYLKSAAPDTGDYFGNAVAIDNRNIAVGVRQEDSNGSNANNNDLENAGAAYLYTFTGVLGVPIGPGIEFTIGGNVSGLPENSHIVLQNQHADGHTSTTTAYANDRRFSFAEKVSSTYHVTVKPSSLPPGVHCDVINGDGDVTGVGNIFNIWVLCTGHIFRDSFE